VEALADGLLTMLTDEKLRADLGKTGRMNVKKLLSLNNMSEGLAEVYNKLILSK